MQWGDRLPDEKCAHQNSNMSCIACHSSWNPSCFGCHLPQKANVKAPNLHGLGEVSRNRISYNFQTLRDDVYMLARDGNATGNRIGPARSSCAIHVGSYNGNRESVYVQQQTISGEGLAALPLVRTSRTRCEAARIGIQRRLMHFQEYPKRSPARIVMFPSTMTTMRSQPSC